ncbi:hypothetical protein cyc_06224 [Cyclospora cayetanensis]|uniref:Small EDRK-rich factor-like N-terminal domain-containing protein n=1 Tax=Cyclospora cayetanensis TaxID=88456 RepID=A0A1D3D8H5_9EIME|nr:hypothetical protein cyc_06224 [Cyclospora cayetanensis]
MGKGSNACKRNTARGRAEDKAVKEPKSQLKTNQAAMTIKCKEVEGVTFLGIGVLCSLGKLGAVLESWLWEATVNMFGVRMSASFRRTADIVLRNRALPSAVEAVFGFRDIMLCIWRPQYEVVKFDVAPDMHEHSASFRRTSGSIMPPSETFWALDESSGNALYVTPHCKQCSFHFCALSSSRVVGNADLTLSLELFLSNYHCDTLRLKPFKPQQPLPLCSSSSLRLSQQQEAQSARNVLLFSTFRFSAIFALSYSSGRARIFATSCRIPTARRFDASTPAVHTPPSRLYRQRGICWTPREQRKSLTPTALTDKRQQQQRLKESRELIRSAQHSMKKGQPVPNSPASPPLSGGALRRPAALVVRCREPP